MCGLEPAFNASFPLNELMSLNSSLATRLQTVSTQLHRAGSESRASINAEQAGKEHRRLANEYNSLLAQARELPGFGDFLLPVKTKHLVRAARNGPVVVINCYDNRCDALLILPGEDVIDYIALPRFSGSQAEEARKKMARSLRRKGIRERGVKARQEPGYKDAMPSILAVLWYDVVKPILEYLGCMNNYSTENLPHITWCPTGALSFLPLHAAGDYDQPRSKTFDYVVSSYTPTLTALLVSTPSSLTQASWILAIGQGATPGCSALPGTTQELEFVKSHTQNNVEYSQLTDDEATIEIVLDEMERHDWVHLACHAHLNVKDPTRSGFFLHGGTLDLAAINRRSFKNKGLAFLSACQTATGDNKLPDEAVHLASGMLMAGYSSVITTMWSVNDRDAPVVADRVYAQLLKEGMIGNGEAGKALHTAVATLRVTVGEKAFERWVPYIHIGS